MENWKVMFNDYPLYEISNFGNVRKNSTNKMMKPRTDKFGFAIVFLVDKNNGRKWIRVDDLMNEYFTMSEIDENENFYYEDDDEDDFIEINDPIKIKSAIEVLNFLKYNIKDVNSPAKTDYLTRFMIDNFHKESLNDLYIIGCQLYGDDN